MFSYFWAFACDWAIRWAPIWIMLILVNYGIVQEVIFGKLNINHRNRSTEIFECHMKIFCHHIWSDCVLSYEWQDVYWGFFSPPKPDLKGIVAQWRQKLSYMDNHILLTGVETLRRSVSVLPLFGLIGFFSSSYYQYFWNMVSGIYNMNSLFSNHILFILLSINFNKFKHCLHTPIWFSWKTSVFLSSSSKQYESW